ncbi:hypothetical protein DSO57_1017875 [Entomophthora muscae]|uniref:Uncharacterized protein n=1 Tax=Entomophthora muscae TaxID=34485 RepID=A0ACC2TF46_9FUNG|nr:hypothetical protein DSO57_1017875 [Entomophthora muscae]
MLTPCIGVGPNQLKLGIVRNILDTYSCVINKLSPAANVKAPSATEETSAVNVQTSAVIKHMSATNV